MTDTTSVSPVDSFNTTCTNSLAKLTRKGYSQVIKKWMTWIELKDDGIYAGKEFHEIPCEVVYDYVNERSVWQRGEKHAQRKGKADGDIKGENVAEQINSAFRKHYATQEVERNDSNDKNIAHMNIISKRLQTFICGRRNEVGELPPEAEGGARDYFLPEEYKYLSFLTKIHSTSIFHQTFQTHMWNTLQRGENVAKSSVNN